MANSKISALTSATTPLAGTEVLPVVQSSTTKQVSVANLTAGRAVNALSITTTNDSSINGQTVGKGGSNVASNTAQGTTVLTANTSGANNTGFGSQALLSNTTGSGNTAVGQQSLLFSTTGSNNSGYGIAALYQTTTGSSNTGIGRYALFNCTTGVATLGAITGGTGYNGGASGGPFTVQSSLSSGTSAGTYPTLSITVTSGVITSATLVTLGAKFQDTTTVLTVTSAAMVTAGFAAGGSGFSVPVATLATANNNSGIGYSAGLGLTTGSNNVILGSYQGIISPISGTGSGYVVLSDGAGAVRYYNDGSNTYIPTGNIVFSTAARGVNFTANTPAAGMTSQLLNWYEEGTWTPNQGAGLTLVGAFSSTGRYTRIGRQVSISGTVTGATTVALAATGVITSNLPFTVVTAGHGDATNAAITAAATVICISTSITAATAIAATATITFSATYFV